jgi:hypothetical protein
MRSVRHPRPIFIDDMSPRTLSDSFQPRQSVDLAGLDLSFSPQSMGRDHVEFGGIAAWEELESIRALMESKSKDLQRKEVTLSRSVSKWNSEVVAAQRLIEELADNLTTAGENRIHDAFHSCEQRLQKLEAKLTSQMRMISDLKSRCSKQTADVPPLPDLRTTDRLNDRILELLSKSPSSVPRQLSVASIILVQGEDLTGHQVRSAINCIFNVTTRQICAKIDKLARQSMESDMGSEEGSSKFLAARQSVLKKRLGLPSADKESKISIIFQEELTGHEGPIDVMEDIDDDLRVSLASRINTSEIVQTGQPIMRIFSDGKLQALAVRNLRAKSRRKSIKSRLIEIILGSCSDKQVQEHVDAIKREIATSSSVTATLVPKLIICFVYIGYRLVEDSRSSETIFSVAELLEIFLNSSSWQPAITRFLPTWVQGIWFSVRFILNWKNTTEGIRYVDALLSLVKGSDCSQALSPWQAVIVERLNKDQIHSSVQGHCKAILRLASSY